MKTTTDFAVHISQFFTCFLTQERNMSVNTIASYKKAFIDFIVYMKEQKKLDVEKLGLSHLTKENVLGFLNWMIENRGNTPATRNQRLGAICSFCKYLQYKAIDRLEQWQAIRSIPKMKHEKKAIEYLSLDGIKLLLAQPDTSTQQGRRHQTIMSLMYETGGRVQEMADLVLESLKIEAKPYSIKIIGKGRKARIVPLSEQQASLLKAYVSESHPANTPNETPLFKNNRGEKLTLKSHASFAGGCKHSLLTGYFGTCFNTNHRNLCKS